MILRVEPDRVRGSCAQVVGETEVHVAFAAACVGIGQLVLVKVEHMGEGADAGIHEPTEGGQIEHVAAPDRVPTFACSDACIDELGEAQRAVPHAPLPVMRWQRQQRPVVSAARDPSVDERTVAAAVVGLERENLHR